MHSRRRIFQLFLQLLLCLLVALTGCSPGGGRGNIENVVLVSFDALGANHSSAYGYHRSTTPNLDQIAADGTLFENAYVQQNFTLSSHFTLFTGVYPRVHGASRSHRARASIATLAEVLKREGFETAGFTGMGGFFKPKFGIARGFDLYVTGNNDAESDNIPVCAGSRNRRKLGRRTPRIAFSFLRIITMHTPTTEPWCRTTHLLLTD
jgi:hypothetical protein